jgi:hypothetical protein
MPHSRKPQNSTSDLASRANAGLALLRSGQANPSEVARLAGVSRQAASQWARIAEIDWRTIRDRRLAVLWQRQLRRSSSRG